MWLTWWIFGLLLCCGGGGGLHRGAADLVSAMGQLQTKAVRPTKNKAVLLLPGTGEGGEAANQVEVQVFARAKRAAVPSLKKEAKAAYDPSEPKSGGVKLERTYRNPLHPDEEVAPETLVKGYK